MSILGARDVRRAFGTKEVLKGATMSMEAGERIGLVGRNGSGKSTLIRILSGEDEPDEGEVVRRNGLRTGVLSQEPRFEDGATAVDAVLEGLADWVDAMRRYTEASEALEAGDGDLDALLAEQSRAGERVEELGGWEKRHEALALLGHVGITTADAPVASMSGGERRRVALARLLVSEPDLAILDEPTNHLDVGTVEWLERFLIDKYKGALIVVTHDRYLLDRVTSRTVEVDQGVLHHYDGGWSVYLEKKALRQAHADRVEANRRNFLRRELEWLRRTPQARSTKQKARVERAEAALDVQAPKAEKTAKIALGHVRSGRTILEADQLSVDVAGRRLVHDLTLRLSKGERIGIVGPNGCGKTSLLRVLTGEHDPAGGTVRLGKNTRFAYLDQTRGDLVDAESIFENVGEGRAVVNFAGQEIEVRTYLERFLFTSTEQRQTVGTLSGGERARVAIARTLRDGANVVILDEPTNDLDVTTLASLEEALLEYPGVLLVVTHDRWFLDRVATSLLVFEDGKVVRYEGGYSDYVAKRPRARGPAPEKPAVSPSAEKPAVSPSPAPEAKRKLTYAEQKELEGLLAQVDEAEAEAARLEAETGDASFYERSVSDQQAHFAAVEAAQARAESLTERWAELSELAED